MEQPPGFVAQGESNVVCKLKKSIYGLKQSPRVWYDKLSGVLLSLKFKRYQADHSVFVKQTLLGAIILVIYVDDIILWK